MGVNSIPTKDVRVACDDVSCCSSLRIRFVESKVAIFFERHQLQCDVSADVQHVTSNQIPECGSNIIYTLFILSTLHQT